MAVNPSTLLIIKYLNRQQTRQKPVRRDKGGVRRSGQQSIQALAELQI